MGAPARSDLSRGAAAAHPASFRCHASAAPIYHYSAVISAASALHIRKSSPHSPPPHCLGSHSPWPPLLHALPRRWLGSPCSSPSTSSPAGLAPTMPASQCAAPSSPAAIASGTFTFFLTLLRSIGIYCALLQNAAGSTCGRLCLVATPMFVCVDIMRAVIIS